MSAGVASRCGVVSDLPDTSAVQGDPHPTFGQRLVGLAGEVVHKQQVVEVGMSAMTPDDRSTPLGGVDGRLKPDTCVQVVVVGCTHATSRPGMVGKQPHQKLLIWCLNLHHKPPFQDL